MSTRDEQKEQRRKLIIAKALELFAKKGYADTKIGDIAAAADMSMGLMFHYFESKEQLYEELVKIGTRATNTPAALRFENPLDYFSGFLKTMFAYAKEQPWVFYMFVLMVQTSKSESVPPHIREIALTINQVEQSAAVIEKGQKSGYFKEGDPYVLSFTFWSAVQGVMEQIADTPEMLSGEIPLPDTEWLVDIIKKQNEKGEERHD